MPADHVCPWWLAYTFDNPLRRLVHDPGKMFGPYIGPGGVAADIGCGLGFFSLGLARLVGPAGRVYSLDLQERMLAGLRRRARRAGLEGRITARQVRDDDLDSRDLQGRLDLALAFWMVHEVPDQAGFFGQARGLLKPEGRLFVAEPRMHVKAEDFEQTLRLAAGAGLEPVARPRVAFSRAAVLAKAPREHRPED